MEDFDNLFRDIEIIHHDFEAGYYNYEHTLNAANDLFVTYKDIKPEIFVAAICSYTRKNYAKKTIFNHLRQPNYKNFILNSDIWCSIFRNDFRLEDKNNKPNFDLETFNQAHNAAIMFATVDFIFTNKTNGKNLEWLRKIVDTHYNQDMKYLVKRYCKLAHNIDL